MGLHTSADELVDFVSSSVIKAVLRRCWSFSALVLFPQQELANFLNLMYHFGRQGGKHLRARGRRVGGGDLREFSSLKGLMRVQITGWTRFNASQVTQELFSP